MARGSENKLGAYPNTCEVCGENIRFSSTTLPLWFATDSATGELHTFHFACHPLNSHDLHCGICGCAFADDNDTAHECPPGFRA